MARKPETRLQQRIQKALRRKFPESWWFKVWGGPFQKAGIPDLIGCVDGLFFALEVKRPGESTDKLQDETIDDINSAGGTATVVESPDEAISAVNRKLRRR